MSACASSLRSPTRIGSGHPMIFVQSIRSGLRLPSRGFFRLALSKSDLPLPKLLPVSTFRSLHCFRSSGLARLSPPGVYLQGSRLPFESPSCWYDRGSCRARSGRRTQYHVSALSFARNLAFCLPAGRPSGRRVSSNGEFKLLPVRDAVNGVNSEFMKGT